MNRKLVVLACLTAFPWAWTQAGDGLGKSIYQGPLEQRVDAIASIQPGLGTVMREIGYRFSNAYWAANARNWGLAEYQLNVLREAEEVAVLTRPQQAMMLDNFEQRYSKPMAQAIQNKDISRFNCRFSLAIEGCNACHTTLGFGFLRYQVPEASGSGAFLDFTAKTEPKSDKSKQ